MRKVLADFVLVAVSSAGLLYLALQSVAGFKYCGTGFRVDNANFAWVIALVLLFSLGVTRLVIDLRK